MANPNTPPPIEYDSSVNIQSFIIFLMAMAIGLLLAVLILPSWMPNLAFSLGGQAPKAYWYLSRASAFAALTMLWLSMALGIGITNKMARWWPGAPAAFAIHEYVSLVGLAFAIFHAIVILGDHYINFTFLQMLVPFTTKDYRPVWVGIGQVGFYVWLIVAMTFYIRSAIGQNTWRLIHYASFAMYVMGLVHGLFSGTDTSMPWAQNYYWISGASLLFLFVGRIVGTTIDSMFPAKPAPRQVQQQQQAPRPAAPITPAPVPPRSAPFPIPAVAASPTTPTAVAPAPPPVVSQPAPAPTAAAPGTSSQPISIPMPPPPPRRK